MAIEIERKFLVTGAFKKYAVKKFQISQGFLSTVPERTVRIRVRDNKGFITIKGIGNKSGLSRFEWEKEIALDEALKLLLLCEPTVIKKMRYIIPTNDNLFFEVDEFLEDNKGLVIAEIELPAENTSFNKPLWLGNEVTGEVKYYNAMLSKKPFLKW
jgi:adenylate cyclase